MADELKEVIPLIKKIGIIIGSLIGLLILIILYIWLDILFYEKHHYHIIHRPGIKQRVLQPGLERPEPIKINNPFGLPKFLNQNDNEIKPPSPSQPPTYPNLSTSPYDQNPEPNYYI